MTSACGTRQIAISALAVFVVTMGINYIAHANLMVGLYAETVQLWRTPADMQSLFPACLLPQLIVSLLVASAYSYYRALPACSGTTTCRHRSSLRFGLWLGALTGVLAASAYFYIPITATLALGWLVTEFVKGIAVGFALSFTYCQKDANAL